MSTFQIVVLIASSFLLYAAIGVTIYGALLEYWESKGLNVKLPYNQRSGPADEKVGQAQLCAFFWLLVGLYLLLRQLVLLLRQLVRMPYSRLKSLGGKMYKEVVDPKNNV